MANVLLGVTGSVAAIMTPPLFDAMKQAGHQVKIVATRSSLYFFDPATLDGVDGKRNKDVVLLDEDEWPGQRWQRGDPVLHIELRRWANVLVIAPLDANTLAKLALGMCDNCLTCVWRAWDRTRPVILAPAMNTLMWEHPATGRHLRQIAADLGTEPPVALPLLDLADWINGQLPKLRIVAPISKRLACDDVGLGAMAGVADIVSTVEAVSN
ncbi:MAG TPA: flavoprotein [Gemmataceae bacterium]|nr:flavoprotein [Gemmataceae bacterium]